jgi:hypothetical protein
MSKRKRDIDSENIPNNGQNMFDNSFEESAEIQRKKIRKLKPKSKCRIENNFIHLPVTDPNGNIIYDGKKMRTIEKEINVSNCFLQGLDKESTASSVAATRRWLNQNVNSNLPVYLINGHSSFDPRLKFEMRYNDEGKRVTRRVLSEREKKEADIRQYEFIDQLSDGMSITRNDTSRSGPNFFNTKEGVFVIEATPVSYDAACGTYTIRRFFRENVKDNFNNFRMSFLSSRFNDVFYNDNDSDAVRLIIPPKMSTFNKTYTFDDENGKVSSERYGILKFSQDMNDEELQSRIDQLMSIEIKLDGDNDEILQKKLSVIYSNSEMKEEIQNSIARNTGISLQQITDKLGPGIYIDFSCAGLVYKIYEKRSDGKIIDTAFDPDMYNRQQKEGGRLNLVIYDILLNNFEELEYQYKLQMQNIVQRDENESASIPYRLPASSDKSYLTTVAMKYSNLNKALTEKRKGLHDQNLMDVDDADTDTDEPAPESQKSQLASSETAGTAEPSIFFGGKKKRKKKRKTRKLLPKLRKLTKKNVRHHYKLKYSTRKRRMAINEGVRTESKKRGMTMKKAAISKKGRFNLLRMYRKNKNPKACRKITKDMRYMDKKYKLGKTKNICKKTAKKKKKGKKKTRRR